MSIEIGDDDYLPPEDDPCWVADETTFTRLDHNYPVKGTEVPATNDNTVTDTSFGFNPNDKSIRGEMLDEAKRLVTGDRNNSYGPPNQDFQRTADMASAWGFQVDGKPLKSHHVAVFMEFIKLSRIKWTPTKVDSWTDGAGYMSCGLECAILDAESQPEE